MADSTPGPVIPQRYLDALGDDTPPEVLVETPGALGKLVRGLTEKQLSKRPEPGKWSIKEIVAHLLDGEVVFGARYRLMASHEKPFLSSYDQDAFVERLGVSNAKTEHLLQDFAMARAVNLGLLERLPEEAFERIGVHAERGEESLWTLITLCAGHDRVHLGQVETIRVGLFPEKPKKKAARKVHAAKAPKSPKRAGKSGGKAPLRASKPRKKTAANK
jgi:hypothetical protein